VNSIKLKYDFVYPNELEIIEVTMANTTVVIPNYNGIRFLQDCLSSIPKEYPVIVVDNGSSDGSQSFVQQNFPEVNMISLPENTGFCHASNIGIKAVKTKYVFLLNNDTTILPDTIPRLESRIEANKHIFSVQSRIISMLNHDLADDCGDYYCALGWAFARGKFKASDKYMKPVDIFAGCGAAVLYRMSAFEEFGMFDETHFAYLEDIDLGYRARIYGYRNVYEPSSVIYHAGSATSGSQYNKFKVDLSSRNSIYLIYKNMPVLQTIINLPFLVVGFGIKTLFFALKKMGFTYLKGLVKGLRLCREDAFNGHRHKVPFRIKHLPQYFLIQIELWINIIRRFS